MSYNVANKAYTRDRIDAEKLEKFVIEKCIGFMYEVCAHA